MRQPRLATWIVAVAVATGVAVFTPAHAGNSARAETVANLWVDTNGGTCRRVSEQAPYVDGRACPSLGAAYAAARGGDTIYVRAGVYGDQAIAARSLGTNAVTLAKDPSGGAVTLDSLSNKASYVTFDGFTITRGIADRRDELEL